MKKIIRFVLVAAIAAVILSPVAIQFNNSLNNTRLVVDGGPPVPPWPCC
jgi:hypothetical protein